MATTLQISECTEIDRDFGLSTQGMTPITEAWACFVIFMGCTAFPMSYLIAIRGLLRELDVLGKYIPC